MNERYTQFDAIIIQRNFKRLVYLFIVIVGLELLMTLLAFVLGNPKLLPMTENIQLFTFAHAITACYFIMMLFYHLRKASNLFFEKIMVNTVGIFIVYYAVGESMLSSNGFMYISGALIISSVFYLKTSYIIFLFSTSYMAYILGTPIIHDSGLVEADIFRTLFIIIMATGISRTNYLMHYKDVEQQFEIEKHNRILKDLNRKDSMTNLLNHKASYAEIQNLIQSYHEKNSFAVMLLDIDFFKKVNDNYGHQAGDAVIIELATLLKSNCRSSDIIGRYGGEEFIVIMPSTDQQSAIDMAERVRNSVAINNFDLPKTITVSIGVSVYRPPESSDDLVKRCDELLYLAKTSGRNQVQSD